MKTRTNAGFTLIELMIVVMIIGILAGVAVPAYQDYIIRSKVSELLIVGGQGQRAVEEYYARWGTFPRGNAEAGLAAPEAYRGSGISSMRVADGVVRVASGGTLSTQLRANGGVPDQAIYLRPAVNRLHPSAPVVWVCSGTSKPLGTHDLVGKAGADMPLAKYLPAVCR
jgi:type IV pilus assembly protein PilA